MRTLIIAALALLTFTACSNKEAKPTIGDPQNDIDYEILLTTPKQPLSFMDEVQPVLDKRCVVCHGCYDAPCQLKLSSYAGVARGANPEQVYDGARIKAAPQTRLFVDAHTPEEWRKLDFHTVLNEAPNPTPKSNLENSVMYKMLRLKERNPQPTTGMLNADVTTGLNRKQVCTNIADFDKLARKHPQWGMPYGMPNLAPEEYKTLVQWLVQGAPDSPLPPIAAASEKQVNNWETFLNKPGLKEKLVSRYIYEHLFAAHIYFDGAPDGEFFRLIRSSTPPGEPALEIPSERPYSDPGKEFWYRVAQYQANIVIKDHVPYEWSPKKMARYEELFFAPDYSITEAAPYGQKLGSNPIAVFADIPADSRYRFMLDDARFYIQGFVKGPVCRGQLAVNVIQDQFWVVFIDPDSNLVSTNTEFLKSVENNLDMPDNRGDTLNLTAMWTEYWKNEKAYLLARQQAYVDARARGDWTVKAEGAGDPFDYIWNGDGDNPNAALTIFRHEDNASVSFGHLGNYPKTAWVIDYPLLERIHYLLVVGFNVYGNVGLQLNTRLYMDLLRMEGEDYFLMALPPEERKEVRASWYKGLQGRVLKLFDRPQGWLDLPAVTTITSNQPVKEVLLLMNKRLGPIAGPADTINRCDAACLANTTTATPVENALRRIAAIKGRQLYAISSNSFLRIKMPGGQPDLIYSLILNKDYSSLSSFAENEDKRDRSNDTLTVLPGLVGSYPNFFFVVDIADIEDFADRMVGMESLEDYEQFTALYGIRRTNPDFWEQSDWFHNMGVEQNVVESGIYDLNRYKNR